jgi:Acetyltransferase (GNAT) domain
MLTRPATRAASSHGHAGHQLSPQTADTQVRNGATDRRLATPAGTTWAGTDHPVRSGLRDPHLNPLTRQGRLAGLYDACMSDGSRNSEELQTARLSLRRPTAADTDAIFEIHSDPRTCLHNPSDRLTQRGGAEELYHRWNEQWQRYGYWVVRCRGSAVQLGFCGIKPMELNSMKILNLFYRFTPSAWARAWPARPRPRSPHGHRGRSPISR